MDIPKNIENITSRKGLQQKEVAERMGIERSNYHYFSKRGDKLTIEQAKQIAKALEVSLEEILFGEKNLIQEKIRDMKGILSNKEKEIDRLEKQIDKLEKQNDRLLKIIENTQDTNIHKQSFEALVNALKAKNIDINDLLSGPVTGAL